MIKKYIYVKEKILYINKKTYKPVKLEIKDNKQKDTVIYILYNEVEINNVQKVDVLAYNIQRKNKSSKTSCKQYFRLKYLQIYQTIEFKYRKLRSDRI